MNKYIGVLFLFLLGGKILGQNIVTDRPDQTESAQVVPKDNFQIESGALLGLENSNETWNWNNNLFRFGLSNRTELRLVTNLTTMKDRRFPQGRIGIGNMEVGLKLQFSEGKVNAALLTHVSVPNSTEGFGSDDWGGFVKFLLSHDISDRVSFGYNFGYGYSDDTSSLPFTWSVAFSLTERIGFFTELYGDWNEIDSDVNLNHDAGFTFLLRPNVQFDFSFGTGITSRSNFYSGGISIRFPGG